MRQERLSDAAIAVHRAFAGANIKHGIFGGYAVSILGGPRESKDIDCIAASNKDQVVSILDVRPDFKVIPQKRLDYVAFLWNDDPKFGSGSVLVEVFPEQYPGALFTMQGLPVQGVLVKGSKLGTDRVSLLDPFTIFKGKLQAAATRNKFTDPVDLRTLAGKHTNAIQHKAVQLNIENIGRSMKRYPELELLFRGLGVDIEAAKAKAANADLQPSTQEPGEVQKGILGA